MAIWDSLGKLFSADNLLAGAIVGGASLYSSSQASKANKQAAQIAARGAQAQADAIREGNRMADQRLQQISAETAPGTSYLRTVVSNPMALTPLQQQQLEETRRQSTNALRRSGLSGSGRAVTAAIKNVESDFTNRAMDSNMRRADSAATNLSGANIAAQTGGANLEASTGRAQGQAASTGADAAAGATIANGRLGGQAIGDLAGVIAADVKGRESRYADRMREMERRLGMA